MAQNLDLNINVNTDQAAKSVGSLKTQLKEAQAAVVGLSDKFGATSVEAVNAAKKAAELRDRIGDARALTDAFNPDQKFKALTSSLSGVAGGFAAVQGAMGLFGAESEDLQKTLVKVQSAMALSQGLEAVGNSIDSFKNLGAVIKNQVISSFSTLRGAIIATGLGALTIGVGLLIANFEKVKEVINNLFPSLGGFADKIKNIVQGFTDFIGVTSQAERSLESLEKSTKIRNEALERQVKLLTVQGGKEKEVAEINKQVAKNEIDILKAKVDKKGLLYGEDAKKYKDLQNEIAIIDANESKRLSEKEKADNKKAEDNRIARNKKIEEDAAARKKAEEDLIASNEAKIKAAREYEQFDTELQQRLMELDEERAAKKRELAYQETENLISDIDYENQLLDNDFEADQQRLINKEAYLAEQKEIELSNLDLDQNARLEIITKYANLQRDLEKEIADSKKQQREAELKADQELQEAKYQIAQVGLGLLSSLAGENERLANIIFAISKALEIGKIISSTAASIAQVNAGTAAVPAVLPPGAPNPAFPTAVAIGAKKIASLKIGAVASIATIAAASIAKFKSGGGGSGVGVQGGGTISSEAPIIPQLPAAQTTNISRQSINDLGNQAVRAYVIETDVTGNQQRMAAIRQRARFS